VDTLVVLLQLILAGVLIVAAVGKSRDLPGSRQAVADFGVPKRFADIAGTALPGVELVIGLGLLWGATARLAALFASLLFIAFIVGIGYNLSKGRQPECHCFGQIHSEPAGWPTLIRNVVLVLASLVIVWQGSVGPVEWFDDLSHDGEATTLIGLALLAVGIGILFLMQKLIRLNTDLVDLQADAANRFEELIEALQTGSASVSTAPTNTPEPSSSIPRANVAPAFDLATVDGERMTLEGLLAPGKPTMLMFADPGCGPCAALTPDIAEWQARFGNEITMAVISRGTLESNQDKFVAKGVGRIGLQEEWEVFKAYEVRGTPSAVLVDADGIIRQPYATGRDNIRSLVSRTVSPEQPTAPPSPTGLNPGDDPLADILRKAEGPELGSGSSRLPLPTIDGEFLSLDDFRGQKTAVVFWNVTCGFCQRMLPDLKEIEEEAGEKIAQILIISQGDIEANREQGLKSRMVIDDGFTLGRAFGANGTPSAIVLDEDGKVATSLAVGADAVLNLLDETLSLGAETPAS
jgi:thiol-disulfide isomerase/thioredoxin/uncharacterized membrane protein YphA (DoxX/SURF4 family)